MDALDSNNEHPRWLFGEPARAIAINVPLALMLASAQYNSWLFQERPHQPDPAQGYVQVMTHKSLRVFVTPGEASLSDWLTKIGWIGVAIGLLVIALRFYKRREPPTPVSPEEAMLRPTELIATFLIMASILADVLLLKF